MELNFIFILLLYKLYLLISCSLQDGNGSVTGTLWLPLMPTRNGHVFVKRAWPMTHVFSRQSVSAVTASEQKLQIATPSYKTCNEKKSGTPPVIVDPASVKVIGEADVSASVQKQIVEKKK